VFCAVRSFARFRSSSATALYKMPYDRPEGRDGATMYKRILLAYDGSVEGRTALREGALLARQCDAEVFLLSVLADAVTLLFAEAALAGTSVRMEDDFMDILNEGVARLRKLGFDPVAKLVRGQPAEEIGNFATEVGADLIVVGHRRQSAFDRWWLGPKGAYLMDYTDCSLLVARNAVSDEAIEAASLMGGHTNG
jgi:nucleotide-binding universal stress UspA family protein